MPASPAPAYDEVFDAARDFRVLLSAMARPGTIHELPGAPVEDAGLEPAAAAITLALLNSDTNFHTVSLPEPAARFIVERTRCPRANGVDAAEFVFFGSASAGEEQLARMRRGTLEYPDRGATLVAPLSELSTEPGPGRLAVRVTGPGVDGETHFYAAGLHPVWLATLRAANAEYPLGVDAYLVCGARMVALPRSSNLTWE